MIKSATTTSIVVMVVVLMLALTNFIAHQTVFLLLMLLWHVEQDIVKASIASSTIRVAGTRHGHPVCLAPLPLDQPASIPPARQVSIHGDCNSSAAGSMGFYPKVRSTQSTHENRALRGPSQ